MERGSDLTSQLVVFTIIYVVKINYSNENISCNGLIAVFFERRVVSNISTYHLFLYFYPCSYGNKVRFIKDNLFFFKNSKGRKKITISTSMKI